CGCDNPLYVRPLAFESVKINDAAAHLESADWRVVLVLYNDLHTSSRLEQRPSILWRRRNAGGNQRDYVLELSERKHSLDSIWCVLRVTAPVSLTFYSTTIGVAKIKRFRNPV